MQKIFNETVINITFDLFELLSFLFSCEFRARFVKFEIFSELFEQFQYVVTSLVFNCAQKQRF